MIEFRLDAECHFVCFFSLLYAKIKYAEADVVFASAYFYSD